MENYRYLIFIDPLENNNKFYEMIQKDGETMFTVRYGRVGATCTEHQYPSRQWDKKLNEKLKKGYTDMTNIKSAHRQGGSVFENISEESVKKLMLDLERYAGAIIGASYSISKESITYAMVESAKEELEILKDLVTSDSDRGDIFNEHLVKLFKIIPRKMNLVSNYLAHGKKGMAEVYARELDLIETVEADLQIRAIKTEKVDEQEAVDPLEQLGLEIRPVTEDEMKIILDHLDSRVPVKPKNAWRVINKKTQKAFDEYVEQNNIKTTKLFWHGSGNGNWLSILSKGLLIRPSGAAYTGSMFGDGIYFAPKASKSWGYTSYRGTYWRGGTEDTAFMGIFNTAYGDPYFPTDHDSWHSFNANFIKKKNANCVHAKAKSCGLMNDEIIFYNSSQVTIQYIVEF